MKRDLTDPDRRHVGIFRGEPGRNFVRLAEKGGRRKVGISARHTNGADDGELVLVERLPGSGRQAKVIERLDDQGFRTPFSLIAIKANGIPQEFSATALSQARAAAGAAQAAGTDLTHIPFLTVDPVDARDRDDAVCADSDTDPANPGGHVIWVAVADVARLVTSGSELDREARMRGNSTYFPDATVPMLPPSLCEDACSLNEETERSCMVVRIVVDADGNRLSHEFARGTVRSRTALHYAQAQSIADGSMSDGDPGLARLVDRLWAAFRVVESASRRREPLRVELPERRIRLSVSGKAEGVIREERLDSHRLIEEFMVLANVCAAETLEKLKFRTLRRVHEEPDRERIGELARTAVSCGLPFALGNRTSTGKLNELLQRAEGADCADHISLAVLRSMNQARYSTALAGHFGLNLKSYSHFTSPIRRYADLVVHRALIRALGLGPDGLTDEELTTLDGTAAHVSMTERRSIAAEREAFDRFAAQYFADRIGEEFDGTIVGTARQGAFVRLDETGSEGIIRRSDLGFGRIRFNRDSGVLSEDGSNRAFRPGRRIRVRLVQAEPVTGSLQFALVDGPKPGRGARRKGRRARLSGRRKR